MFFSCIRFRDSSITVYRWTYANICSTNRQWLKLASFFFKEQINFTWFFFLIASRRFFAYETIHERDWKALLTNWHIFALKSYTVLFFSSFSRDEMWKINHHAFNFGLKVYESPFWFFIRVFSGLFREESLVFSFVF